MKHSSSRLLALLVTILALCSPGASAEPELAWPQFLGSRRDGISRETGLNLDWQAHKPKVLWQVPLGGGYSSQSFADGRLFTQAKRKDRDIVVCLEASTGKELWSQDVAESYLDGQRQGAGPRATPTYEKGRIYCLFPRGDLLCLTARDGKEIWKTNILEVTGAGTHAEKKYYWGMSGSPLLEGDVVVVQPGGDKNNSVAAFHKDTGKLVWSAGDDPPGYGSPIAITAAGRRQVVCSTGSSVLGLDPVQGKILWRHDFGNPYNCNCATPLWVDNVLFLSAAYQTGSTAVEIVAVGDGVTVREKWRNKNMLNQFATSMVIAGHAYGCSGDFGAVALRCIDLKTGELKWTERKPGKCSLIAVEGHLVCLSETGALRLIEANPKSFVVKGEWTDLLTRKSWAVPAIADKKLYVRDDKNLICLDLGKE